MIAGMQISQPAVKKDAGFTLVELLVVVVILGVLTAIAVPTFTGVVANARKTAVVSDITNARKVWSATAANAESTAELQRIMHERELTVSQGTSGLRIMFTDEGITEVCVEETSSAGVGYFQIDDDELAEGDCDAAYSEAGYVHLYN